MFDRTLIRRRAPIDRRLIILVAAFLILSGTYSVITPIFEAGDELWHYPYVQYLATGHGLPIQDPVVKTLWAQEGGQPPLYYALAALTTFWIDTSDLPDRLWYNPEAKIGIPLVWGNKNMIVHTSAEDFPWRNTALAVHLIRVLSILFAAGTVALTYLAALEIKPDKTLATVAAALVAFNPMFLFISASVNNDNLTALLATLCILLLLRLVNRGQTLQQFVILGVVLGLAVLSKVSNLALLVVAGVVFAYLVIKSIDPRGKSAAAGQKLNVSNEKGIVAGRSIGASGQTRRIVVGSLTCAALVLLIGAWWYLRNWMLYDDPLALDVWVSISGGRPAPATLTTLLDEFQSFRISYWGNFGGVNIIAADWVYTLLDGLSLLAVCGLIFGIVRRSLPRLLCVPGLLLGLVFVSLIRWTMLTLASQGRLIFPAVSAVGILMAYGLAQWKIPAVAFRDRLTPFANLQFVSLVLVVFLMAFSVTTPFVLIAPAYALPARFPDESKVSNATHIVFDHRAELVGYDLPSKVAVPGGELPLTVYWRALEPIDEDLSVYIRLFDAGGNVVGRWNAFPGGGSYPTRFWKPGEVIADVYRIPVAPDAIGPGVGRIEVGLYRRAPVENLTAYDPQARVITPTIARFKIANMSNVEIQNPVRFQFGSQIALVGYSVENVTEGLRVRLYWRARQDMNVDYTVFVHLVGIRGNTLAQDDNQPQRGAYPTSFWGVGETVIDEHLLQVPEQLAPGDYQVVVGVYRAEDGTRLIVDENADRVVLATVPIGR